MAAFGGGQGRAGVSAFKMSGHNVSPGEVTRVETVRSSSAKKKRRKKRKSKKKKR